MARFVFVHICLVLYIGVFQAAAQEGSSPRPLWQLDIRRNEPVKDFPGPRAVSDKKRVFYLQGGQVKAVDAATGQQLWTYRIGNGAQLRYSSGSLLAITYGGKKVVALEPRTGKVGWERTYRTLEGIETFTVQKGLLLVVVGERFIAYDLGTGRERWRVRGLYGLTVYPHSTTSSVSGSVVFLELGYHSLSSTSDLFAFDRTTGERLWKAFSHFSPLAVKRDKVYSLKDDYPFNLNYPDRLKVSIFDLRSGKPLGRRVYNVAGSSWNKKIVVANAVYISSRSNLACFPLIALGGEARPNFIRVPRGYVGWLAGPHDGTFLLEWQGSLWLARQQNPCTPIVLRKRGARLVTGKSTRTNTVKNGMYIGLKDGTFYAVNMKTGRVVLELTLRSRIFGPTHVVGSTLIIQAGNKLLAYRLPAALKP